MQALGLTQAEPAQRLGLSRVMIGLMERGLRETSARTRAAVLSAQPRPLERTTSTFAPLTRKLETAFITNGIAYEADCMIDGQLADFHLVDLGIALFVETSRWETRSRAPMNIDMISIVGKSALNAFITLIQHGGVHACLSASQDPYAVDT